MFIKMRYRTQNRIYWACITIALVLFAVAAFTVNPWIAWLSTVPITIAACLLLFVKTRR